MRGRRVRGSGSGCRVRVPFKHVAEDSFEQCGVLVKLRRLSGLHRDERGEPRVGG
jgi:hypothetical protein